MSDDTKREGTRLYLVGFNDFKVEFNAGAKKVKKWRKQGAPISNVGGTYRASTERLLEWLENIDREEDAREAS